MIQSVKHFVTSKYKQRRLKNGAGLEAKQERLNAVNSDVL
jgi:hypothetical protein